MAGTLGESASPWLVLAIGIPAYQAAMPSPQDSRMADPRNPRNKALARSGEVMGMAVMLAVGVSVAVATKSPEAVLLALVTGGILTLVHEIMLHRPGFRMED